MHIALIIDEERLTQEQAMLNRLCIGLMAEGVQVTRIVPDEFYADALDEGEQRIALAARIEAPMKVLPWMKRSRTAQIAEELAKAMPDALYAIGEQAWALGMDIAQAVARPVVIDVCSSRQAEMVPRGRIPFIAGYVVPSRGIADVLRRRMDASLVNLVPMGIAAPVQAGQILEDAGQSVGLAVIGQANDVAAYESLLRGVSAAAQARPQLQLFLELRGPREHEIWRVAERLDLLGSISTIAHASPYRSLLTHCDVLLIPDSGGELRSMMLEAMALGMPVIARQDPALDILVDGQTAWLLRRGVPEEWQSAVLDAVGRPEAAREIGLRGRQAVLREHRSSDQVSRLISSLETLLGSGYRFASPVR